MSAQLPHFSQMLEGLVGQLSVSSTQPELDVSNLGVINLLANWLDGLGFTVQIQETDVRKGKANLIARLGPPQGGLIFSGHTDTVPFDEDLWNHDPLSVAVTEQGYSGLGTTDMKGFFAVLLDALQQLPLGGLRQGLCLVATADEESSFGGARQLAALNLPSDARVIIGEPTDLVPVNLHKGIMMESIQVIGKAGHSSDPSLGINAIEVMQEVLSQLMAYRTMLQTRYSHPGLSVPVPTLNPGCIHGGDNPNRICSRCQVQFDIRSVPGMKSAELLAEIDALIEPIAARWQVEIRRKSLLGAVEPFEQRPDTPFVSQVEALCGAPAKGVAFATEAPFFQALGLETLVLGPGSIRQAHQANEYLAHSQIARGKDILRSLIERNCY